MAICVCQSFSRVPFQIQSQITAVDLSHSQTPSGHGHGFSPWTPMTDKTHGVSAASLFAPNEALTICAKRIITESTLLMSAYHRISNHAAQPSDPSKIARLQHWPFLRRSDPFCLKAQHRGQPISGTVGPVLKQPAAAFSNLGPNATAQ